MGGYRSYLAFWLGGASGPPPAIVPFEPLRQPFSIVLEADETEIRLDRGEVFLKLEA